MATQTLAGNTWNTTAGDKTVVATPALADLIIVFAGTSGLAGGTISVSDNNSGGAGAYTQISSDFTGFSTTGVLTAWIRTALIRSATSTTFTATQTGSSGGGLVVYRISGMSIVGLGAVRGAGGQSSGGAGTTPAPVLLRRVGTTFSGTQAALTGNLCCGAICNGTSPAGLTPPASWTESPTPDLGYATPTTGIETCFRNSGETGSTITWGSTSATAFASIAIELDASVPQFDYVTPGRPDMERILYRQGAVGRATNW